MRVELPFDFNMLASIFDRKFANIMCLNLAILGVILIQFALCFPA